MPTTELIWNPWHGCHRYSAGCKNCYVYRRDDSIGKDASQVVRNTAFDLPVHKKRDGSYKLPSGSSVYLCMTSDFFIEEADAWREEAWRMIRERQDVHFTIITKRILRFADCIPPDWGDGYENVSICCTMENQAEFERRMPCFLAQPIRGKYVICEPLLSPIDFGSSLAHGIRKVVVGGESGFDARPCAYDWVLDIRRQCIESGVPFYFKQTGARLIKDGVLYRIPRKLQHSQARNAGINTAPNYKTQ